MNSPDQKNEDRPINLEESSSTELKRVVVTEDDVGSSSTVTPVWVPKPHAKTDRRELLGQPFDNDRAD